MAIPTALSRMSTGVPGCDEILGGGLIAGRCYLIGGDAGAGKTSFSLQWLLDGARCSERCMYINLCEPAADMQLNVVRFGWHLDQIDIVDLSPVGLDVADTAGEYHIFPPSEVENVPVWKSICDAVQQKRPQRLMIDSVTQLRYRATDEYQFRKNILGLVNF